MPPRPMRLRFQLHPRGTNEIKDQGKHPPSILRRTLRLRQSWPTPTPPTTRQRMLAYPQRLHARPRSRLPISATPQPPTQCSRTCNTHIQEPLHCRPQHHRYSLPPPSLGQTPATSLANPQPPSRITDQPKALRLCTSARALRLQPHSHRTTRHQSTCSHPTIDAKKLGCARRGRLLHRPSTRLLPMLQHLHHQDSRHHHL